MYQLKIINSSVRPGRKGPVITDWIADIATKDANFETEVLDLGVINLPMMDERNHPALKKYEHEHTLKWSAMIDDADSFIFVTPEYDHSYPASLHNALEYLSQEWAYKPAAIVSYGGVSGGTRAMNNLQLDLVALKIAPIYESVNFPFFQRLINEEGKLVANEISEKAAISMMEELLLWTKGLKAIREEKVLSRQYA